MKKEKIKRTEKESSNFWNVQRELINEDDGVEITLSYDDRERLFTSESYTVHGDIGGFSYHLSIGHFLDGMIDRVIVNGLCEAEISIKSVMDENWGDIDFSGMSMEENCKVVVNGGFICFAIKKITIN